MDRKEDLANDVSDAVKKMKKRKAYSVIPASSKSGAVVVPCELKVAPGKGSPALTWENFSPHVLLMGNVKVRHAPAATSRVVLCGI
jgi:hypothetical protein